MARRDYPTEGITVHWGAEVCQHSGICAATLPRVFRPQERPWIRADHADADTLAQAIDRCPSGALSYTRTTSEGAHQMTTDADAPEAAAPQVTITPTEDGPYEVRGPVSLLTSDGRPLREGEKLFLCRCGQSAKKPYCDGSHKRVGFRSTVRAKGED